jgi:hypothetical protein
MQSRSITHNLFPYDRMPKFDYFSIVFPTIFICTARRHKCQTLFKSNSIRDSIRELSQPIFEGEIHRGAFVQIVYAVHKLNRKIESSISNSGATFCYHRQKKRWSKSFFPRTQEPHYPKPPVPFLDSYNPQFSPKVEHAANLKREQKGATGSGGSPAP